MIIKVLNDSAESFNCSLISVLYTYMCLLTYYAKPNNRTLPGI
ncbi:hypothetical protein HanPSC8_Chr09g0362161 [Helianthus annuus]|nr:hypothetical protein HanPSC8_Chr09g0362161 [Helianthus annuus]